jgi:hypothetical protein
LGFAQVDWKFNLSKLIFEKWPPAIEWLVESLLVPTRLDIKFPPLTLVDVPALIKACDHPWYNQTLCKVNDSVVRLGIVQGEYHWHKHDDDDEFFFVLEGCFIIEMEERTIELHPNEGFVVPKGVMHCPRAPQRTVILMVETTSIMPTGSS